MKHQQRRDNMKIQTGHKVTADVKEVKAKSVSFCTDDGRVMFEVSICKDGKSIEVRGVENTKHNEIIYTSSLIVKPRYSNSIEIHTNTWGD